MKNNFSKLYDITQSFEVNAAYGPGGEWVKKLAKVKIPPTKKPTTKKFSLLGHSLSSVFGVSACPLTINARSIGVMSKLGYDILTYRGIRTIEWRGNPFPQWLYAQVDKPAQTLGDLKTVTADFEPFADSEVSMVNSFGINTLKPEYWQADIDLTMAQLPPGKLLIVSLMATPGVEKTLVKDVTNLARLAAQTKAPVFELNLACPNTDDGQGLIYEDIKMSLKMCQAAKKEIGHKPLMVKVGYYSKPQDLKKFMDMSQGIIAGLSSTNTYSVPVVGKDGQEIFPGRPSAGLSGSAIRLLSMAQAQTIMQFKKELALSDFTVIGIGGVIKPSHIEEYLGLGVNAVQAAVGVWNDPELAMKYKRSLERKEK